MATAIIVAELAAAGAPGSPAIGRELVADHPDPAHREEAAVEDAWPEMLAIYREHDWNGWCGHPKTHRVMVLIGKIQGRLQAEFGDDIGYQVWSRALLRSLDALGEDR